MHLCKRLQFYLSPFCQQQVQTLGMKNSLLRTLNTRENPDYIAFIKKNQSVTENFESSRLILCQKIHPSLE
jgi:hypothetical protein